MGHKLATIEDGVVESVLEFNSIMARDSRHRMSSNAEKSGIFYNTLRRHLAYINPGFRFHSIIPIHHIYCSFRDNGELDHFRLDTEISWRLDGGDIYVITEIKNITKKYPHFEGNRALLEMDRIINSLKNS